ncbi:zinc finger protein 250 [Anopheles sinensis]|uniref:Zinc finger protein 250 n=1 Tax=Anopheles sinensis TaxID=74873 RepID=A0A084WC64_ANOSI|nr:zinc finger protein 250 [Anopheles sinensis]
MTNGGQQQFVCDSCHTVFDRPEQLKKHIQLAHGPAAACSRTAVVSDTTIVKRELCEMMLDAADQNIEQDDMDYMIDYEDEQSKSDSAAQDQHQQALFCRECGLAFTRKSDLLAHMSKICNRSEPHECQLCGEKFPNEIVIKQHVQECHRHELTDSSCAICGKLCKNQNSLMKHSYDHSRERVHCCSKCGKTFHHMGRLKRHMGSHRNKTVRCEVCGEEFPDGRSLMNHRHSHSKSNNYPCKECGKTFGSRSSQQIHLRIHTGERPYACRFCWKAFADGGTLRKHERVHTGEKPYGCSVCPKEFNQRVVLREHIRAHHSQPEPSRGSAELPYYCPVCNCLFATGSELVQHLIEHSDTNTAMKRKPPTFPRKYKRRRKLKPHELERLQSGRRKQKTTTAPAAVPEEDDDEEENEKSMDDGDGQQQYERPMSLEREDGTLKTSSELFYEYGGGGGDSSKPQKLTVASSNFISPYELLAEGAASSGGGRAHKRDLSADGMIDDIGINLLSNGNYQRPSTATTAMMSSKFNNNDHKEESPGKRRATKGVATVASKSPMAVGLARMIRTEPANKRAPVTKANGETRRATSSKAKRAVAHSSTKEHIIVPPREVDPLPPPEVGSVVSHVMEAFSELERKRSHERGPILPSYVREIPSSRISENFPLLDDGNTIDTMEEQLIDGCLDEARTTLRQRYGGGGSRQRFMSTASSGGISGTREEEDEQLLMEISRGEKYTDRFNSDIVNDLAEILRSPLKASSSSGATTTTSVPPVDILASPSSRHAVLLPPIAVKQEKSFYKKEPNDTAGSNKKAQRKKTASNRAQKARVQSTPSNKAATSASSSAILSDPYANSLLYGHGRRLTRRQLEREVSFLSEAFAPGGFQQTDAQQSNVIGNEGTSSARNEESTFSSGEERLAAAAAAAPVVIKQENVVPEKLAEMLLNDGIPLGVGSDRSSSSRSSDNDEGVLVGAMVPGTTKHKQRQHEQEEGVENVKSTVTNGYRCSICAAYFADRSQLILHVPVHM